MQIIIGIAILVAQFLGTNFAQEWACWEDLTVPVTAEYRYMCEYSGIENGGTYAAVWSSPDGVQVYVEFNQ